MKKILFFVLLLAIATHYFHESFDAWGRKVYRFVVEYSHSKMKPVTDHKNEQDTLVSKVYELKDTWLYFDIAATQNIKITTLANIKAAYDRALVAKEWSYKIELEVISTQQEVLLAKKQHLYAKVFLYEKQTRLFSEKFYNNLDVIPSTSDSSEIQLSKFTNAHKLRVRLLSKNPEIHSVVVRVYNQIHLSDYRAKILWQRLSQQQQQQLARNNVYPHNLLRETEKLSLLRNLWKPLAPSGIPGVDYNRYDLFNLNTIDGVRVREQMLPDGFLLDENLNKTIGIPKEGATILLQFFSPTQRKSEVQITWYGKGLNNEKTWVLTSQQPNWEYKKQFAPGLIEITTQHPLVLQGKIFTSGEWTDLQDTKTFLRSFLCAKIPISYRLFHENPRQTPLRIDIRSFALQQFSMQKPASVRCILLTKDKKIIKTFALDLKAQQMSRYDSIWENKQRFYVSEVQSYYTEVPNNAYYLQIQTSSDHLVVNVYNRPPTLTKNTIVPDDYFTSYDSLDQPLSWFLLLPQNYYQLLENQQSRLITIQRQPPEENPYIKENEQPQWQTYQPIGKWLGQLILIAENPEDVYKDDEALPYRYFRIASHRKMNITFLSDYNKPQIEPQILFHNKSTAKFFPIKVYLDDELVYFKKEFTPLGEISLPLLDIGQHILEIKAPSYVHCYLNYIHRNTVSLRKQMAIKTQKRIRFVYQKTLPQENMLFRVFHHWQQKQRSAIRIKVKNSAASDKLKEAWTFEERIFIVKPQLHQQTLTMHSREVLDEGQLIIFPLNEDIDAGEYQIEVELLSGTAKYLTLTKLQVTSREERKVYVK